MRRLQRIGVGAMLVALVASPVAGLFPAAVPGSAPVAVAAASGLTMNADARYVVDPAKHRVHVRVALTATNHRHDTKTHRYFFDLAYLAVQPGTTNFKITSSGVKPRVTVQTKTTKSNVLRIEFGKQLAAGSSRMFILTFDIPDPGGAATRPIRIGTSLVSFGAWGLGGNEGAAGGSVTVVFPPGFTIDVTAAALHEPTTDAAGNAVYASGPLGDPLKFFAYFVADRPSALKETPLTLSMDGQSVPIALRAWPDDPAWAKRVGTLLTRGMPALSKAIGLPWTVGRPLVIEEAVSRSATGFAGRYNPTAGRIEIAYYAGTFVVLHEAAHAWFDGSLLVDRWASEGFASWYAIQAATAIGEKNVTGDLLTPALEKLRVPLNAWGPAGAAAGDAEEAEYAASLKLAGMVAERAGPDMANVWRMIRAGQAAYQPTVDGDGDGAETTAVAPDWRGLLDLLEDGTGRPFADLWGAWVVRPAEAGLLGERAAARERYEAVRTRAADWRLPRVVRDAMRAWQFDQATELLDGADRALDDREAVAAAARTAGIGVPDTMRIAFEGERGFAAASAEGAAELAAIATYRDAAASRPASPDLLETIGLWNAEPNHVLDAAALAFAAGELEATVQDSALAEATWRTARDIGRNRVIAVTASLAALLLGGWLLFRWFRDRKVRRHRPAMARRG
ncbi:MAG TPA: hypothetical protein VFY18_14240 [Candidatus Limnocylindrales bacterium]|nr:hypothetical protein [Candidatus Limnocylindrales bacterium]